MNCNNINVLKDKIFETQNDAETAHDLQSQCQISENLKPVQTILNSFTITHHIFMYGSHMLLRVTKCMKQLMNRVNQL